MDNNEEKKISASEQAEDMPTGAAPFAPSAEGYSERAKKEKIVFTAKDRLMLAAALVLALYPAVCFSLQRLASDRSLPAIGSTVFFLAVNIIGGIAIGKNGAWTKANRALFAAACVSSLVPGLWSYWPMQVLSHFAAFILTALALLTVSGMNSFTLDRPAILGESFVNAFVAAFGHFFVPFRAVPSMVSGKKRTVTGIIIGVAVCIPLIAVCAALLSSGDLFFREYLEDIGRKLFYMNIPRTIWYALRTLFFALMIFSVFYSVSKPKKDKIREIAVPDIPVSASITVLAALNILYLLYFFIVGMNLQFAALFVSDNDEVIFGAGGYAQYARTGFFQLAAVAGINLTAIMTAGYFHPRSMARRVFSFILLILTSLLLVTAAARMCMYIGVYGLSFLRLLTFYFMAVIACAVVLCVIKEYRPGTKLFPILFGFAAVVWLVFSLSDPAKIIADYNVDAYLDGRIENIDVEHLKSLSASALPALRRLEKEGGEVESEFARAAVERIGIEFLEYNTPRWYEWCADILFIQK